MYAAVSVLPLTQYEVICHSLKQIRFYKSFHLLFQEDNNLWGELFSGWRDKDSITMEPLQNMVEDWPEKVKEYCEKNRKIKDICRRYYGHLFE